MSGGGGKGGGKKTTTETTVPEWVRAPADRNLQRAEALQQIEYMPYYGAQVAAFNDNQAAAFQNNNNAASAFGLLAPTDAMSSMPTPTTYANGMKGYSSIPLYDQAMADLKTNYGDTVDAYDSLFGNAVPANVAPQMSGGGGGGGSINFATQTPTINQNITADALANQAAYEQAAYGDGGRGKNYTFAGGNNDRLRGLNQAKAAEKKGAKIRYSPGSKYGFGL